MKVISPLPRVSDTAPELVRRLGLILAGIVAVVARRFLKDPTFHEVIVPLCGWLNRALRRFARVRVVAAVPCGPGAVVLGERAPVVRVARVRLPLPSRRAWLLRALGWEVAGYGSQLQTLLAEPEMVALLAALPAVGRVLRPLGRMLGVPVGPVVVKVAKVRVARVRRPRPRREKPWSPGRSPVSWWGGAKTG